MGIRYESTSHSEIKRECLICITSFVGALGVVQRLGKQRAVATIHFRVGRETLNRSFYTTRPERVVCVVLTFLFLSYFLTHTEYVHVY